MSFVKRLILQFLKARGYVLLKESDVRLAPRTTVPSSSPNVIPVGREPQWTPPIDLRLSGAAPSIDFSEILLRVGGPSAIAPAKAYALYTALSHLTKEGILGDIVDCGDGSDVTLGATAAFLLALGDTSRRLILFDITGDPTHGGEIELPLWGSHRNHLDELPSNSKGPNYRSRALPRTLAASGYPAEKISILRYPTDSIDCAQAIGLLSLTPDAYPSNRAAIGRLVPRVPNGGVIAAECDLSKSVGRDAVTEVLDSEYPGVQLWQVADNYRIGVKAAKTVSL